MRFSRYLLCLLPALSLWAPFQAAATNGAATYSGGAFTTGTAAGALIAVTSASTVTPAGTLSFSCPITTYASGGYSLNWTCAGGSVTMTSTDRSLTFTGSFLSGSMTYTSSGGGKGGRVIASYQFQGAYSGTLTANGVRQLVYGSLHQLVETGGQIGTGSAPVSSGSSGWNSGYSPLLAADSAHSQVLLADNITGANLVRSGSAGSGADQFGNVAGLAQDTKSSLYLSDSALDRIIRVDRSTGSGWTTLGSLGNGVDHFSGPRGIAVDSAAKIWVADAGNSRIVRFNDISGAGWTAFGAPGAGVNEFNTPSSIAFDPKGRIYVADTGNNRLIRFDDVTGKNWTTLSQVTIGTLTYPLSAPSSIAINPAGQVYVALGSGYLVRVDDITGVNGEASYWGGALTALSVDSVGTLYVAGNFTPGLAQVVDGNATGYFASALGSASVQVSALLALSVPQPPPAAPVFSTTGLSFASQNVGHASPSQALTLTNLGAATLTFKSLSLPADYQGTSACPASLPGGSSCSGTLFFRPVATGARNETLTVGTNSAHPLLQLALTGTGTAPSPVLLPTALSFDPQRVSTASSAQTVTLTNAGSGALTIKSVTVSAGFSQTSNCIGVLAPGSGCTLQVIFQPSAAGAQTGSITVADDAIAAGTTQVVALAGTGAASAPAFTLSPESLQFPAQQVNTTSGTETLTLANASGSKVTLSAPAYPANFIGSTTCGASLASGASCNYSFQFSPKSTGSIIGRFTIPLPAASALSAGLSGTSVSAGRAAVLSATPSSLAFGDITIGDNPSLSTTLTNTSGVAAGMRSVALSGDSTFSITSNTCPSVLASHASCTVTVTFLPLSTSAYANSSTLSVVEATGAITSIPVSGYAVAAAAALRPK